MQTLTIRYDSVEELCHLLRTTFEKLPTCESSQDGLAFLARLNATSRGLPTVSINVQDERLDEPRGPSLTSPTGTFSGRNLGTLGDFEDPLFLQAVEQLRDDELQRVFRSSRGTNVRGGLDQGIEDPFFGPNVFQDEVVVADAKGKTSVQRKIPFDLDLLGAINQEGKGNIFGTAIIGLSRGIASLLGLGNTTVSDALARASGGDKRNVHVAIGLPVIDVIPGDALKDQLLRESDLSLLEGNVESLRKSITVGKLFEGGSAKTQAVIDRNKGNLEILRQQALEEEL